MSDKRAKNLRGTIGIEMVRNREGELRATPAGAERDRQMAALVAEGWTYEAVGWLYGLSRERVRQIARRF